MEPGSRECGLVTGKILRLAAPAFCHLVGGARAKFITGSPLVHPNQRPAVAVLSWQAIARLNIPIRKRQHRQVLELGGCLPDM
jgi:hypothetical protein